MAYVVVKEFDMDDVNVIPSTWVVPFDDDDDDEDSSDGIVCEGAMIDYKLPSRRKLGKNFKFDKKDKPKKNWPVFGGKVVWTTNSKADAQDLAEEIKARQRKYDAELNYNRSNSSENGSGSGENSSSEPDEENPPKQSSTTEKKKTEQKIDKNDTEKDTMELHSRCQNFYSEFNTSFHKTMTILDSTVDFLETIISTHKNNLATKV